MFLNILKLQKICDKAVEKDSNMLMFVLDYFKTQEMCEKVVKISLFTIMHVPDQARQICEKIISKNLGIL